MIEFVKNLIPEEGITNCDGTKEYQLSKEFLKNTFIHVESTNNFPTAAGVASSSSGLACLAACLAKLYGVQVSE